MAIEWIQKNLHPTIGFSTIIANYIEGMNDESKIMYLETRQGGIRHYKRNSIMHHGNLSIPDCWQQTPRPPFFSQGDLFHEKYPDWFIHEVFVLFGLYNQHIQVLTKESLRLLQLEHTLYWTSRICMGVSVENNSHLNRIDNLKETIYFKKFVSFESLSGPLPDLDLIGIDWVIVGGGSELGKPTQMKKSWVFDIRDQCQELDVQFYFKRWVGENKDVADIIPGHEFIGIPKKDSTSKKVG
jgi:protein gp37